MVNNVLDDDRIGILHACALSGDDTHANEIVQILVAEGVDVNLRAANFTTQTALHLATFSSRVKYAKALLNHGARCNVTDFSSETPISTVRYWWW